jgi:hypothetical protein
MFININLKFSQLKSEVCFTILQTVNQNIICIHSLHKSQKIYSLNQIIKYIRRINHKEYLIVL